MPIPSSFYLSKNIPTSATDKLHSREGSYALQVGWECCSRCCRPDSLEEMLAFNLDSHAIKICFYRHNMRILRACDCKKVVKQSNIYVLLQLFDIVCTFRQLSDKISHIIDSIVDFPSKIIENQYRTNAPYFCIDSSKLFLFFSLYLSVSL